MTMRDTDLPTLVWRGGPGWDSRQIAALRERRGWTQERLAEESGLSVRTIRNLELGVVQNPRRSSVDLLAQALGVEIGEEPDHHGQPVDPARWRGPQPGASVLVGDRSEHDRLMETVRANRLTTFLGPGGIGKTRHALHVAARIGGSFRDGVAVVELGDLVPERYTHGSQAAAVLQRIRRQVRWGRATDLPDPTAGTGEDDLNLLLILDNAEHVPDGVTAVTRELLASCPGIQVLITARRRLTERLGVNREIQPLSGPAAVELVGDLLAADSRGTAELGAELPMVAELCRRLGGLPRYLEFAAERMRTLPVQQLLAHGPTMDMLWSNDRALLEHQRSAADSVRWNLDLLGDAHTRLLMRITALPTRLFTLDDVVAEPDRLLPGRANPLTLLSDLHETSLVLADPQDRYRYRLAPFVAEVMDRLRLDGDERSGWPAALAS
jgi:predicted ATPase/DNA-binding XRE family transcriptional regulator